MRQMSAKIRSVQAWYRWVLAELHAAWHIWYLLHARLFKRTQGAMESMIIE